MFSAQCSTFRLGWQEFFTVEEVGLLSSVQLPVAEVSIFFMAASEGYLPELLSGLLWLPSLTPARRKSD